MRLVVGINVLHHQQTQTATATISTLICGRHRCLFGGVPGRYEPLVVVVEKPPEQGPLRQGGRN